MNYYLVDAFSRTPFSGNAAAVCLSQTELDEHLMQRIAMEMNQSETAFVVPLEGKRISQSTLFSLRWFTPLQEVELCGHATLASAKVLFSIVKTPGEELAFETRSGVLTVKKEAEALSIQLPMHEPRTFFSNVSLHAALRTEKLVNVMWDEQLAYLLVHLPDEDAVKRCDPDYSQLLDLDLDFDIKGLIVTARGSGSIDFVSRFFAPWMGINEDPVTGSSHAVLFPYWENVTGKRQMKARQLSRRGGELLLRRAAPSRLEIQGHAVVVAQGEILTGDLTGEK